MSFVLYLNTVSMGKLQNLRIGITYVWKT